MGAPIRSARSAGPALPTLPVIALAGNYCSGKSTIADVFARRGWLRIDVDTLGHEVLIEKQQELVELFSADILNSQSNSIDRKKLADLVFADPAKLSQLESIVHPAMVQRVQEIIASHRRTSHQREGARGGSRGGSPDGALPKGILIDAALLYKMKLDSLPDIIFWIQSPIILRLFRARRRDKVGWKHIIRRFASQKNLFPQPAQSNTDVYRVYNIFLRNTLRRINQILQVRIWNRTKPT